VDAGQNHEAFWRTTPREAQIVLAGAAHRIRRERANIAWLAWHIAALGRAKKMPQLETLMPPKKAKPSKDSRGWQQQYAAFAAWAQSFQKG
jgi:hypothetical protein